MSNARRELAGAATSRRSLDGGVRHSGQQSLRREKHIRLSAVATRMRWPPTWMVHETFNKLVTSPSLILSVAAGRASYDLAVYV
jgi:hypothetical protein